ncbi:hypothetical protein PACILC2_34300 [Paenibacillus cisolokensis]|uniref:Uncharacterized protein n=1 Tax=Paenibacillus cisolokensis TaxID=1658519 RepID=A0ABQ4N9F2_9BACL|nr:hypothetical protein PACILC2_34300 [Paenibacillus cisolokensis]
MGKQRMSLWNGSPPRVLVCGFALIILLGTVLLSLPIAVEGEQRLRLIDAFLRPLPQHA